MMVEIMGMRGVTTSVMRMLTRLALEVILKGSEERGIALTHSQSGISARCRGKCNPNRKKRQYEKRHSDVKHVAGHGQEIISWFGWRADE